MTLVKLVMLLTLVPPSDIVTYMYVHLVRLVTSDVKTLVTSLTGNCSYFSDLATFCQCLSVRKLFHCNAVYFPMMYRM